MKLSGTVPGCILQPPLLALQIVLDRQISDTVKIGFVLESGRNALKAAAPEIMNSAQGSPYWNKHTPKEVYYGRR